MHFLQGVNRCFGLGWVLARPCTHCMMGLLYLRLTNLIPKVHSWILLHATLIIATENIMILLTFVLAKSGTYHWCKWPSRISWINWILTHSASNCTNATPQMFSVAMPILENHCKYACKHTRIGTAGGWNPDQVRDEKCQADCLSKASLSIGVFWCLLWCFSGEIYKWL